MYSPNSTDHIEQQPPHRQQGWRDVYAGARVKNLIQPPHSQRRPPRNLQPLRLLVERQPLAAASVGFLRHNVLECVCWSVVSLMRGCVRDAPLDGLDGSLYVWNTWGLLHHSCAVFRAMAFDVEPFCLRTLVFTISTCAGTATKHNAPTAGSGGASRSRHI